MNYARNRRRMAMIVSSITVFAACISCSGWSFAADEDFEERELTSRKKPIEIELLTLVNHEWAGKYHLGDGLGLNWTLLLAPKSGATFEWRGCLGLYYFDFGKVTEKDGRIKIEWARAQREFDRPAGEYLLVRWGDRKYLVPREEILKFCQDVKGDEEPRNSLWGSYYLQRGDEKKPAIGRPLLPKGFEKYLTMLPLTEPSLPSDRRRYVFRRTERTGRK